jgi:uncharacterized UBP type Zn finger protein
VHGMRRRNAVAPAPSEQGTRAITNDLGGIPNLGNTCYMNAVLQIIAKLYPGIFDGKSETLAKAGKVIVEKIKEDQGYVTREEAQAFYTAFLAANNTTEGEQESSDECMDRIWEHLGLPAIDNTLGTPYITLGLRSPEDAEVRSMRTLLDDYAAECTISSGSFFNDIVPIKLNRRDYDSRNSIKINTAVKGALQLTITTAHIPALLRDMHCRLDGFIVHAGSSHEGHYFTYIKKNGRWKLYSDDKVREVLLEQAEKAAERACLYFYSEAS